MPEGVQPRLPTDPVDEELDDVRVRGELPLGEDRATVTCPHRHEHVVSREGSDAARDFRQ